MFKFFRFQSKDEANNQADLRFFKIACYLLTAMGLAWGMFLVSKNESNSFFGMVFDNPLMIILVSIVTNLIWAAVLTYFVMFLTSAVPSQVSEEVSPRDNELFKKIGAAANEYNERTKDMSASEKKRAIENYVLTLNQYASELSDSKINHRFKRLIEDRIKKLTREANKL